LREWRDRAIPFEREQVFNVLGDICRDHIDLNSEVQLQRREYNDNRSYDSKLFRVVGVRIADADDGSRMYITNLPNGTFSPEDISTLYRARWALELLFRELKSQYGLGRFQTEKEHIVRIQAKAALLTPVVSRAIVRLFVDYAEELGDDCVFPTERWATTFRSYAQQVLSEIVVSFDYDPNLPDTWYREAR
jgi:IS4 transposase